MLSARVLIRSVINSPLFIYFGVRRYAEID